MPDAADGSSRVPWREATVESIVALTRTVKAIRLRTSSWQPFLAGQHVDVRLTAPDGYAAHRSYSVTSPPHETGVLELAIERLDDGEVSPYFHDVAQVGDTVEVRGPFARHFVWRSDSDERVLLVAGGSGVAPFISMMRERATIAAPPPMTLLYSARTWDDVIYREALLANERRQRFFRLVLALTRAPARRVGDHARRVDAEMLAGVMREVGAPHVAYVCGRNAFVERVASALVDGGLPAAAIRTERYGGELP